MTDATKTVAILFSAKPSMVEFDDAVSHLAGHKELYWEVGFPIVKDKFSFPMFGFIHVSGEQVRYRVQLSEILPHSPDHYENSTLAAKVKPQQWRDDWKNKPEARNKHWRSTLVMTEFVPFSFETTQFEKFEGGKVTLPPHGYVRVIPPNEPAPAATASPVNLYEKYLEELIVQRLHEVEAGLRLENRQLKTPAGRLDLLCTDTKGDYVVVELKRSRGSDTVVGQILRYMGWIGEQYPDKNVRGIVIVEKRDSALNYAAKAARNVEVKEFTLGIK